MSDNGRNRTKVGLKADAARMGGQDAARGRNRTKVGLKVGVNHRFYPHEVAAAIEPRWD